MRISATVALAALLIFQTHALAAPQIECTAKRMDKTKGQYEEIKLDGGVTPGGILSASVTSGSCYFQAQSLYPETVLQVHIRDQVSNDSISTYSGYDPKGYAINTLSKDDGKLMCMLVCTKK